MTVVHIVYAQCQPSNCAASFYYKKILMKHLLVITYKHFSNWIVTKSGFLLMERFQFQ